MLDAAEISLLTPDDFPDLERKSFKNVKLSAKKYETIANVLDFWETNKIDWTQLSDPEVKTRLSKIKGVGPWTIDMILLYTLKRPDIFNYDDFHIKQIMTTEYGLNPKVKLKAQMKEVAEPWRPFRSTAFRYLLDWKYFKNQKSAI